MYNYHLPCKYVEDEKLHHTIKFFFMFIQMILNVWAENVLTMKQNME